MQKINLNGQIIDSKSPIATVNNRALKYGDGLFETMRCIDGHIPFLEFHYNRFVKGLSLLQITGSQKFNLDFFKKEVLKLTGDKGYHRVRFTGFRSDGGLYSPIQNDLNYLIEISDLPISNYFWSNTGLEMGIYDDVRLHGGKLSPVKTISALPYVMASIYKHSKTYDDVFMVNYIGRIAESSNSNLFISDGEKLFTPTLSEGCVDGIIRQVILKEADALEMEVHSTGISIDHIRQAKSIFLTNSIVGIRWVKSFESLNFTEGFGEKILKHLNKISQL